VPVALVTFEASPEIRAALADGVAGAADLAFLTDLPDGDRPAAVRSAGVVLAWNVARELRPPEFAGLEGVRFLQLLSAGANVLPFDQLPASLLIASNVGAYAEPMAEHVLAMVLALAKRLPQKHAELSRGEFLHGPPTKAIDGMRVGILGFGGIGKATARRFRPLGARIHAVNTSGRTDEDVEWVGTLDDLDRVLAAADVLVIALPLTKATRGLIGERELGLMKPDAILVNVARGQIIDERALYERLRDQPQFMAGIDAWWVEPFGQGEFRTGFPFFDLPNLLGSPHNSAIVPGIPEVAARHAGANVARFLRGEPVMGLVRREEYVA
jgi:phosphoglycerate dehydrogenase-like enzyme